MNETTSVLVSIRNQEQFFLPVESREFNKNLFPMDYGDISIINLGGRKQYPSSWAEFNKFHYT